jgi:hypothetical protein
MAADADWNPGIVIGTAIGYFCATPTSPPGQLYSMNTTSVSNREQPAHYRAQLPNGAPEWKVSLILGSATPARDFVRDANQ